MENHSVNLAEPSEKANPIQNESEEKLKLILSAAPIGIGLVVNRVIEEVNDFFCKMIGYERDELIGRNSRLLYTSDEEYNLVGEEKYYQISQIGIGTVKTRFKKKNGEIINVVLSSKPFDQNDLIKGVIFTVEDITEKTKYENELKLSEEKFRKAFFTSPESININRLSDGLYISVNENFLKLSGYSQEEILGKTSIELNIWDNPQDRTNLVNELKTKGFVENLEADFKMKNGEIIHGLMSASLIQLDGTDCLLSITRDITERKKILKIIKDSEENYQQIIHGMQDMVFVINMKGEIVDANNSAILTLGYSKDELINMHVTKFDNSLSNKQIEKLIDRLPSEKLQFFETQHITKDKKIIPVEVQSTIITYHGEKAILSIARNITERKKTENELKISEENLKTFFNSVDMLIFILNEEGKIIEINDTVESRLGYKKEELLDKTVLAVHPPEKEKEVVQIVNEMLGGYRETCPIPLI